MRPASPQRAGGRPSAPPEKRGAFTAWRGPVFWPDAYRDIHGYALWPQAYGRAFWGFAFNDVFAGIFWPPTYASNETTGRIGAANEPPDGSSRRRGDRGGQRGGSALSPEFARVCNARTPELTGWSSERIAQAAQPTAAQQIALDDLTAASAKAIEMLRTACPTETPPTAVERLDAMANRLAAMLDAVNVMRPPLHRFYQSLNDEQKARFNRAAMQGAAGRPRERGDPAGRCRDERVSGFRDRTIGYIGRVVQPTKPQRAALDDLSAASAKASKALEVQCSKELPLTPTGRLDAVGQRLAAMLRAVKIITPAMQKFYGLLRSEQKARFNTMTAQNG